MNSLTFQHLLFIPPSILCPLIVSVFLFSVFHIYQSCSVYLSCALWYISCHSLTFFCFFLFFLLSVSPSINICLLWKIMCVCVYVCESIKTQKLKSKSFADTHRGSLMSLRFQKLSVLYFHQLQIVRSKSVERLSFSLTVATFFTSTSWTLYGLQLQDYYIMVKGSKTS